MSVRPAPKSSYHDNPAGVVLAAVLMLFVTACSRSHDDWRSHVLPDRIALRSALEAPDQAMLRQVYAARNFEPIWMGGETKMTGARQLVWLLERSDGDGLDPARYNPQALENRLDHASRASSRERAKTELLLTTAYIAYVHDLHTPTAADDVAYTDRDLQPALRDQAEIARQLAGAPWPKVAIEAATPMNPLYVQMRDALAHQRTIAPRNDPAEAPLLRNLDRLRALPSQLGDRFVLVDVAANRLWLYQNNRPVDSMKVVVGAPTEQTPQMAALIRYAIYNPFWNVPPDLTRDTYAPKIAASPSALSALRMDAWSGFTPGAQILNPRAVNWSAVARGETIGWLRQRPGPDNSMGAVKFMLPNELGIYLHDTPHRELFDKDPRFFSAGCIRVEDYRRLSRWLFGGAEISAQGSAPEQRFDLPAPVPVYIVYLTARVDGGVVQAQPDVYGRDRPQAPAATPASPPQAAPAPPVAAPKAPPPAPASAPYERSPGAAEAARLRPALAPQAAPPPAVPKAQTPPPAPVPAVAAPRPATAPVATPKPAPPPPPVAAARVPVAAPPAVPAAPRATAASPPPASPPAARPPVVSPAAVPPAPAPKVQTPSPLPPAPASAPAAAAPKPVATAAAGGCRIQAGVFSQRANADNLAKVMAPLGDVRLTEVPLKGGTAYSVVLGGLATRKDAESALSRLNSSGKLGAMRITGCGAAG